MRVDRVPRSGQIGHVPPPAIDVRVRFDVDDVELAGLHARAFGNEIGEVVPWRERLERHSLTWVGAFHDEHLVGFVHAAWDGGKHAFVFDTVVDPAAQRMGIGARLIAALIVEVTAAGCTWLHVDYEADLAGFYEQACGFSVTRAGLRSLRNQSGPSAAARPD